MQQIKIVHYLLTLSFVLIISTSNGIANESAVFQSWTVTCGDDGYCTATTPDQSLAAGVLTVRRSNDKKANWEISVKTKEGNPSQFGLLSLRIAGQRLHTLRRGRDYATFSKPNEFFLINTAALELLFRRMIESRRVFFVFGAKNQKQINASYSLNGLSNSLLWIDEQQNRIGSRRTVEPPIERTVTQTKAIAFDAKTVATKLHLKTLDSSTCDLSAAQIDSIGVTVEALDNTNSLVIIPCYTAADHTFYRIFVVDQESQTARLQLWATYSAYTGWDGTDSLSNVRYDKQSKELTMGHKGRDLGDCGIRGTWVWRSDGRFEMKEFAAKDECDGKGDDWPIVFPLQSINQ